jgi:hypothetical protein
LRSEHCVKASVARYFRVGSTRVGRGATTLKALGGKIVRRRLEIFIPIVLLSVLVQLIAPISAFRVVANAVSDPLNMASICSGMASSQDASQTAPAKMQHDGANCCAFCGVGHGGAVAVDPPPLAFVTLQRQYQLVSWLEAADPMPAVRVGSNAQARAPPPIS